MLRAQLAAGDVKWLTLAPEPPTFRDVAEQWVQSYGLTRGVRVGTLGAYQSHPRQSLYPHLGDVRIDAIDAETVEALIARWRTPGGSTRFPDRGLSAATTALAMTVLGLVLRRAVRRGLIATNPLSVVEYRRPARREHVDPFSVGELRAILAAAPAVDPDLRVSRQRPAPRRARRTRPQPPRNRIGAPCERCHRKKLSFLRPLALPWRRTQSPFREGANRGAIDAGPS